MISYMVTYIKNGEKLHSKVKEVDENNAIEKAKKLFKIENILNICLFKDFKKEVEPKDPKSYYQSRVIIRGSSARKYGFRY